jgi:cell division septum initiation protein DivIVA
VKKDADKLQVTIQQLQVKNKNLRQELEEMEAQLDDAEVIKPTH